MPPAPAMPQSVVPPRSRPPPRRLPPRLRRRIRSTPGKNDFIAKHKLVVFRLTQHWNQRKPDPRAQGLAAAMGWTKYKAGDDGLRYEVPAHHARGARQPVEEDASARAAASARSATGP